MQRVAQHQPWHRNPAWVAADNTLGDCPKREQMSTEDLNLLLRQLSLFNSAALGIKLSLGLTFYAILLFQESSTVYSFK